MKLLSYVLFWLPLLAVPSPASEFAPPNILFIFSDDHAQQGPELMGQFADPATWPKTSADGPFDDKQLIGMKTIAEAIAATKTVEQGQAK